ncbi:MAG: hypothetical protein QM702_21360 [Rubrivivax sp.]
MKCIYCQSDSKYSERSDGNCPSCKKRFAFEPKTGSTFTDMQFKNAIDAVSSMGTVRFLPEHVRYELARRKRSPKSSIGTITCLVLAGIAALIAIFVPIPFVIFVVILLVIARAVWPGKYLPFDSFSADWTKWCQVHGTPKGLILKKAEKAPAEPYRGAEDIQHYSFDRAVICDRPETVDLLLANNFHFENNCAVLSIDGYPGRAFDRVKGMLQNNPKLTVYVLHDATWDGCRLASKIASSPQWFLGRARVVEVGIRPVHAKAFRGVWSQSSAEGDTSGITAREAAWLQASSLELFAVRPEQVIKRLFKAITTNTDELSQASAFVSVSGGGDFWVDAGSFSSDASASDGGDDSFG